MVVTQGKLKECFICLVLVSAVVKNSLSLTTKAFGMISDYIIECKPSNCAGLHSSIPSCMSIS